MNEAVKVSVKACIAAGEHGSGIDKLKLWELSKSGTCRIAIEIGQHGREPALNLLFG